MYEVCRLLAAKKAPKVRAVSAPAIRPGKLAILTITGETVQIIERDAKTKSAWYVQDAAGRKMPYSFSRDCLKVQA